MIHRVRGVLAPSEAAAFCRVVEGAPKVPGTSTAGRWGRLQKRNSQLPAEVVEQVFEPVLDRVVEHPDVQRLSMMTAATLPTVAVYTQGDFYAEHVDSTIQGEHVRADVSYTLFLSSPCDYDGGELRLTLGSEQIDVKGDAGDLVLYPSGTRHEVRPVTKGRRLVMIGWLQSAVRSPARRSLLAEFRYCLSTLHELGVEQAVFQRLAAVESALLRESLETL